MSGIVWILVIIWTIISISKNKNLGKNTERPMPDKPKQSKTENQRKPVDSHPVKRMASVQSRQQEIQRIAQEKLAAENVMSAPGESNVLEVVEELMVKGPNTEIAFSRDFVSEGMELLNRIQSW